LTCVFQAGARQRALFAVRFSGRRTAKSPVCHAFFRQVHGKELMFAVRFACGARQRVSHVVWRRCRQLLFFAVRRAKTHAKIVYRALSDVAHSKGALPCTMLPCTLCRAP
jgi:hypothetical protein